MSVIEKTVLRENHVNRYCNNLDTTIYLYHRKYHCSAQGIGGVPDGWPLFLPPRGKIGGAETDCPLGRGGPSGDPGGI